MSIWRPPCSGRLLYAATLAVPCFDASLRRALPSRPLAPVMSTFMVAF